MRILSALIFTPLLIPLFFCKPAFELLGQPTRVCILAQQYINIVSFGQLAFALNSVFYHQAYGQGKPQYGLIATSAAALTHIFLAPYLCNTLDMKLKGVAIASTVQYLVRAAITYLAARFDPLLKKAWVSMSDERVWDKEGFREMQRFGWSTFLVKVMGWWAFDVFTLLAATLPQTEAAAG